MDLSTTDEDVEVSFDFTNLDTVSGNHTVVSFPRFKDGANYIEVRFRRDDFVVYKRVAGTYTFVASNNTMPLTQDKKYKARVVASGDDLNVYVAEEGEVEVEVFDLTDTDFIFSSQNQVRFAVYKYGAYAIDNVRILADDLDNDATMIPDQRIRGQAPNSANEMPTLADRNGTTTYTPIPLQIGTDFPTSDNIFVSTYCQ